MSNAEERRSHTNSSWLKQKLLFEMPDVLEQRSWCWQGSPGMPLSVEQEDKATYSALGDFGLWALHQPICRQKPEKNLLRMV